VTITVNGTLREITEGATLQELLERHGVPREGSAVAVNDDVVPRARHRDTALREGDRVEIIVAVAGG
jgi:sulfur carrier protein